MPIKIDLDSKKKKRDKNQKTLTLLTLQPNFSQSRLTVSFPVPLLPHFK